MSVVASNRFCSLYVYSVVVTLVPCLTRSLLRLPAASKAYCVTLPPGSVTCCRRFSACIVGVVVYPFRDAVNGFALRFLIPRIVVRVNIRIKQRYALIVIQRFQLFVFVIHSRRSYKSAFCGCRPRRIHLQVTSV